MTTRRGARAVGAAGAAPAADGAGGAAPGGAAPGAAGDAVLQAARPIASKMPHGLTRGMRPPSLRRRRRGRAARAPRGRTALAAAPFPSRAPDGQHYNRVTARAGLGPRG